MVLWESESVDVVLRVWCRFREMAQDDGGLSFAIGGEHQLAELLEEIEPGDLSVRRRAHGQALGVFVTFARTGEIEFSDRDQAVPNALANLAAADRELADQVAAFATHTRDVELDPIRGVRHHVAV